MLSRSINRTAQSLASQKLASATDTHLIKLQGLQNRVLRTIGNFPMLTPVRELHMAFNMPYIYDYIKIIQETSRNLSKS
jgi:hypothetical protein